MHRSLATLALRLERSSAGALAVARALRERGIEVYHPSDHAASAQMLQYGCLVSFTLERLTVLSPIAGIWPCGSRNMRVSKSMRGRRLPIAMASEASLTRLRSPSPGMPARNVTFVVVPGMLFRPESAAHLLERLELHYLANPDPQLRFALQPKKNSALTCAEFG